MTNVKMPDLELWQKEIVNYHIENPKGKWVVTKAIRQVGKSICLQWLLVYVSLSTPNSESVVVSPIMSQSRKLFNDILKWANKLIIKSNSTLLQIEFVNNSIITFASGEQGDTLRGKTIRKGGILAVDEAAYINENFFYEVLVPMCNVFNANIYLFSTPKYRSGLFYNLYTKGMSDQKDNVISFDWTTYDTSKFLPNDILEMYRQQLPKLAFKSEYLGEFIDGDGSVFSDFKECVGNADLDPNQEIWISIDWGTGQGKDDTVLTIGQYNKGLIQVSKCISFNDKNTNQTIDTILYTIEKLVKKGFKNVHIIVEKNSIGQIFYDMLCERTDRYEVQYNDNVDWRNEISIRCSTFTTTNQSKDRIVKKLIVLFENNRIIIPDDNKLLTQLSTYECKISSSGNPVYNAPIGSHDDTVMSLCILVGTLYNEVELV